MKKIIFSLTIATSILALGGCKKDSAFLDVPPLQVIPTDVAFSDPALVLSILGDLYNRQIDFSSLDGTQRPYANDNDNEPGWRTFADFSESFPSENGSYFIVQRTGWNYEEWQIDWNRAYAYIREVNLFIQRDSASTELPAADKARFMAEARFLRANYYFEMVKRFGGVPLITSPLEYDPSKGDVSSIQVARAKEADIYSFIINEAEAIKDQLPVDVNVKSRATKAAALALESRAALYAGSIAKYGATTPAVSTPGGEVGIPASMANDYYTIALRAAEEIINGAAGPYKLYQTLPDLADNFAAIFTDKSSVNAEAIWIEDFKAGEGKVHNYTVNNQPYSNSDEGGDAGRLNPSLNLVESFELLDGSFAPLATKDGSGNLIYYDDPQEIFAGRDARLAGTVLLPNGLFKGARTDIWAGYQLGDGSIVTSDNSTNLKELPGTGLVQVVGEDGTINGLEFRSQTGFYIRKWLDPTVGSGRRGRGSDVALIRYRMGEVLLNAAEAAFELDMKDVAAGYMNQVRARAGLATPLTGGDINFDRIVHERRVELAFEGHILYDYKRWRIAHKVWDGAATTLNDLVTNIGVATKRSTQPWGLWPYKIHNPGNPNHGKWIFKETLPAVVTGTNSFRLGNYYSKIPDNIIGSNPKIVRQPNQ